MDEGLGRDLLLADGTPEGTELRADVAPLVVRVLVAWGHLLHGVDVHVDVRCRVGRVQHLAEGENKAASGILGIGVNREGTTVIHEQLVMTIPYSAHHPVA